jgi:hypothetical protein
VDSRNSQWHDRMRLAASSGLAALHGILQIPPGQLHNTQAVCMLHATKKPLSSIERTFAKKAFQPKVAK